MLQIIFLQPRFYFCWDNEEDQLASLRYNHGSNLLSLQLFQKLKMAYNVTSRPLSEKTHSVTYVEYYMINTRKASPEKRAEESKFQKQ